MRAYFFVNSALSGIQKGIQVAHCLAEMANKAAIVESWPREAQDADPEATQKYLAYVDWFTDYKTIIVLEGGFHQNLKEIRYAFEMGFDFKVTGTRESPFPWASFSEDEETMNGMMTCVGIILPERIYEAAKMVREHKSNWVLTDTTGEGDFIKHHRKFAIPKGGWSDNFTMWEVELITLINSCPLAR